MTERFIFSWENRWLKKYYDLWKKKKAFGTYVLIGASGSGKSIFAKQLIEDLKLDYCIYTGKEIETLLLKQVRENRNFQIQMAPVMVFEDIDCLIRNPSMRAQFEVFISQYQVGGLILMTAIDFTAFQLDGYAVPVNPLRVNLNVVRKKAKEYQVKLSIKELWKLSRCKRISQVEAELRKIKMKKAR